MSKNFPGSFLEIKVSKDSLKKYVGKPIIYHHLENEYSCLVSAILEDISDDQIFIEKPSLIFDEDGNTDLYDKESTEFEGWVLQGEDFRKDSGNPPLLFKHIKSFYVPKMDLTLEEMQDIFLGYYKE